MSKNTVIVIAILLVVCLVPASVIVYNMFLNPGCGPGRTVEMEEYSVSEWGIFKQEYNTENMTYLSGPRPGSVPRPDVVEEVDCKPVIYFHGDGEMELSVNVVTNADEIVTIPFAIRTGGNILWNVRIAGDINDQNDDAKVVVGSDEAYDYLFYEGKDEYPQNLLARITNYWNLVEPDRMNVNLQNIGEHGMEDIYVICDLNRGEQKRMLHFSGLDPNETINRTTPWKDWTNGSDLRSMLKTDLISRGLTDTEAEDLLNYWIDGDTDANGMKADKTLLDPEGKGSVQILFFLTEEEYDQKLPLELSKEPKSINRVGIGYVSDIPIMITR